MMDVIFNRSDGNIERPLESKEHVSGMIIYCDFDTHASSEKNITTGEVVKFSTEREAREYFSKKNTSGAITDIITYNIGVFFEYNPSGELYVNVVDVSSEQTLYSEIEQMQKMANGEIRQLGVLDYSLEQSSLENALSNIQKQATLLENNNMPLSILLSYMLGGEIPAIAGDYKNITLVAGFDGGHPLSVSIASKKPSFHPTSVGLCLAMLSKVSVNESVESIKKCRLNMRADDVMFANGYRLSLLSTAMMKQIDEKKFIYPKVYTGVDGVYFSDSHTLGKGDYNTIEIVRTMDKAVRNIRARLIMELGSPLYIDAETGRLDPATVKHLEVVAGKELEVMQKAGEISGWSVEIDSNQDVLGTSTVEFVIKKVPVGVFRKGVVNIGYAKKIGG